MIPRDRTRRALSNRLLFSPYNSSQPVQNCKKLLKTYGCQEKLVAICPQTRPKPMNETLIDRAQRALWNALFTFSLAPMQTREKPQILQKNDEKITYFLNCRARFAHRPDQNL